MKHARAIDRQTDAMTTISERDSTGVPMTPPGPTEPRRDDEGDEAPEGEEGTVDVPATPPTEPPPVPVEDPPAEPGGNRPQIVRVAW